MSKRDQVKYVKKAAPVKTFLAHWGVFLSLLLAAQVCGHVVIYPAPVKFREMTASVPVEEDGGWLSSIMR